MHEYSKKTKAFLSVYVAKERRARHMTKEAMAEQLRLTPRSLYDIENGHYCASAPTLLFFLRLMDDEDALALLHEFAAFVKRLEDAGEVG